MEMRRKGSTLGRTSSSWIDLGPTGRAVIVAADGERPNSEVGVQGLAAAAGGGSLRAESGGGGRKKRQRDRSGGGVRGCGRVRV